jgi:hypothetical protein
LKRVIALLITVLLLAGMFTGCARSSADQETGGTADYTIGIVTPTLSTSEDEFRAAQNMAEKYPGVVKHITLPENFSTEIETGLSQISSLADDPKMKAIIVVSGQAGLLPAKQAIRKGKGFFPAQFNVLPHCHIWNQGKFLMDHANTIINGFFAILEAYCFPLIDYLALISTGFMYDGISEQYIHQSSFACPVSSYNTMYFPGIYGQINIIQGDNAFIAFFEIAYFQNGLHRVTSFVSSLGQKVKLKKTGCHYNANYKTA